MANLANLEDREIFVPARLEHQTPCFMHKRKLEVFHDDLCASDYLECPECREEMFEDIEKYFTEND